MKLINDTGKSRVELAIDWFKNNAITSIGIIIAVAVIGLASFTDALEKLLDRAKRVELFGNRSDKKPAPSPLSAQEFLEWLPPQIVHGESMLGITGQILKRGSSEIPSKSDGEGGFIVRHVDPDTPAGDYGIQASDFITHVDGTRIWSWEKLEAIVRPKQPGSTVEITLWRNNRVIKLALPTGSERTIAANLRRKLKERSEQEALEARVTVKWTDKEGSLVQLVEPMERRGDCFVFGMPLLPDGDTWQGKLFPAGLHRHREPDGRIATLRAYSINIDDAVARREQEEGLR